MRHTQNIDELLNTLQFAHKMFAGMTKFVCSSVELVRKMLKLLSGFYSGSNHEDIKFMFGTSS
jgi:hypothetical protein